MKYYFEKNEIPNTGYLVLLIVWNITWILNFLRYEIYSWELWYITMIGMKYFSDKYEILLRYETLPRYEIFLDMVWNITLRIIK